MLPDAQGRAAEQGSSGLLRVGDVHPPRRGADAGQRAVDQLGQGVWTGEDQPDRRVDRRGRAELHRRQRCAGQSPCVRGLSVDRVRAVHGEARRGGRPAQRPLGWHVEDGMRAARFVMSLILTAHGSADPRSAASAHEVAHTIRMMRRDVDVRVAFCEQNIPNLRDVLAVTEGSAVVVPLLLADAYHARVDIPALIAQSGVDARQADVLGEDDRLIAVLRQRLTHAGISQLDPDVGVLVTAVGSSRPQANARTAMVADYLAQYTRWMSTTAFSTGPSPSLAEAADALRKRGATRLVIAPWFLAHGRITDRVAEFARAQRIPMAAPLGPHRLVADTVLDRFDEAVAARAVA